MIGLVRDLRDVLAAEQIAYCHWKSTTALARSCTGENDLDLLVRGADADRLAAALERLGFKQARAPRPLPGILDYYGYDADAERLVHAHIHFRLVVGDDLTKNYILPLEEAFLEHARFDQPLPVPPVELEYVVLVIRLVIKHCTWDAIVLRRGRISAAAREELNDLHDRVEPDAVMTVLAQHLPFIEPEVFAGCEEALRPGATLATRARAGRRLLARLAPHARRSRPVDVALKTGRLADAYLRRRPKRKKLVRGGALVAVVGADGAGKTTTVDMLHRWLSRDLQATRIHLGKPPRSLTTRTARLAVMGQVALRRLRPSSARSGSQSGGLPVASLHAAIARDRYRACRRARRSARAGTIVVADRFPQPQITLMDGPKIEVAATDGRLVRRLARVERAFYDKIDGFDVLVVLRVHPDIAVARKPEEEPEFVRVRNEEVWGADWTGTKALVIDAARPQAEVFDDVRAAVWAAL